VVIEVGPASANRMGNLEHVVVVTAASSGCWTSGPEAKIAITG
jgi:hypothetical protein